MSWVIHQGDCREVLRTLPAESVQCCVTSPPYWGLRDYGVEGQLGLERTPEEYVEAIRGVFREVHRVLRSDGTLWLNLGDCYCTVPRGPKGANSADPKNPIARKRLGSQANRLPQPGLKHKDLVGAPWRVAFALQADGWWLRQEIIWHKRNPMPEAVTDRPTRAHEQVFLLTKSASYFYDRHAIMEPVTGGAHPRGDGVNPKAIATGDAGREGRRGAPRSKQNASLSAAVTDLVAQRNRRSVWSITTKPYPGAHFATFPPDLVEPCIAAGSSERGACGVCGAPFERVCGAPVETGGPGAGNSERVFRGARDGIERHLGAGVPWQPTAIPTVGWEPTCSCGSGGASVVPCSVLDPFSGAGTTGLVARRLGRSFIGIELNPSYIALAERRIMDDAPLLNAPGGRVG